MDSVVLVTFEEPSRADQALSELRRLHGEEALAMRSAAIVQRDRHGQFFVPEDAEHADYKVTMSGGLIGSLLGLLVGPAADTEMAERSELMLLVMSRRVLPGTTALLADLDEPSPEVLETVMYKLGGTVTRQARAGVEAELEVAEEATRAAQREAERVMRERRKAEDHETLGDKLHDLKDKAAGA